MVSARLGTVSGRPRVFLAWTTTRLSRPSSTRHRRACAAVVAGASPGGGSRRHRADRYARRLVATDQRTARRSRTRLPLWLRLGPGGRAGRAGRRRGRVVLRGVRTRDARGGLRAGPSILLAHDLVVARTESTIESLHDVLGGADLAPIAERLAGAVTTVATANVAGRPLFAGLAGQPWPDDPYGRLWRACELLASTAATGTSRPASPPGSVRWR